MAEIIGYINCPECNQEVVLKSSKKEKCYYNCGNCGQFFARTLSADEKLRARARKEKDDGTGKINEDTGKREKSEWDSFWDVV